jgi:spore maturation protein CgeB
MAIILYLGDDSPASTSFHRAQAFSRLGHNVIARNPFNAASGLLGAQWLDPIHYRIGYRLLQTQVKGWLVNILQSVGNLDVIWVDSGELLGLTCVKLLNQIGCPVVLYNVDDPTGRRDGRRFDSLLKALPFYDLVAVVRKETEEECIALGAKRVVRVLRSYDEEAHRPFTHKEDIPAEFYSEVVFIGTWMRHEKRDEFLLNLINQGIPLTIRGSRWQKSPHWEALKSAYKGGALGGREYVAAIQGAKICLGLLSKGNRDLHTQRSLEVPFAGGLFCAERTSEHLALYKEGEEAVFWADAAECASVCKKLLLDNSVREDIRLAGMKRVKSLQVGNEDICRQLLQALNIT